MLPVRPQIAEHLCCSGRSHLPARIISKPAKRACKAWRKPDLSGAPIELGDLTDAERYIAPC